MKIVFLSDDFPPLSFGGAGISTYELARAMEQSGHEVSVITTCRDMADAGEWTYEGLHVFRIQSAYAARWRSWRSIYNAPVIRKVESVLHTLKPDVVHINNVHFYLSYHCFFVARKHARRVVFTARDVMAFNFGKLTTKQYLDRFEYRTSWIDQLRQAKKQWNPFLRCIVRRYVRYADHVCAISNALRDALAAHGIGKVTVVYNGIDPDDWVVQKNEIADFKKRFNLEHKKALLFSGRLSEPKGGSVLMRALPDIIAVDRNVVLLVVASVDAYAERMKEEAKKLGVLEHLIFTGWIDRSEIKVAYGASDIVLMPSICFDAFGRVNIEAMVSKKPVVSTCYGGSPEVVEDGVTGYIIDPRDPRRIAEKVIDLLKNPDRAKRFGEAGYERVLNTFHLKDVAREYVQLYQSASKKH